jgi:hypothetical protein
MSLSDPSQSGEQPWGKHGVAIGALLVAVVLIGGIALLVAGSDGIR